MSKAIAEVPLDATCIGCGYRLRGLGGEVCPECGRAFSRNDPTTYRAGRIAAGWRAWAQPPSMIECVAIGLIGIVILVGSSYPPELESALFSLGFLCGGPIWLPLVLVYVTRAVASVLDRARASADLGPACARPRWRWGVVPLFVLLVGTIVCYPWPMVARFRLSQRAFEAAVAEIRAGTFQAPRWVGLYEVSQWNYGYRAPPGSISFKTNNSLIDTAGFTFTPWGPWKPYRSGAIGMSVAQDWYAAEY